MKRRLLVAIPLLLLVALLAWFFRPRHESLGPAYVSERNVTLYNSMAQVREPLATLHHGDRVEILSRRNDNVRVRTSAGTTGWLDGRLLMDLPLWQRSMDLLSKARSLPVQARGRTKVATNLRLEPGRTAPRLHQFSRGVPVEIVGRGVADWIQMTDEKESANEPQEKKKADWFLIRGLATGGPNSAAGRGDAPIASELSGQPVPIAGWVVARFIELDLPEPVRDGAASASMRPLAWFELNRVPDPAGDKPQYLLAGTHEPEGQPCDFTALRVYTWNAKRSRYETAFIEKGLCGALPIRIGKGPKGEPEFRFSQMDGGKEERVYRLMQTVVRRARERTAPKRAAR